MAGRDWFECCAPPCKPCPRKPPPAPSRPPTEDERIALAVAANLALDNVESLWKRASRSSVESLWQRIERRQSLGELRLYRVLHTFLLNDDYQASPTVLRQTDGERLHEMLALLREVRNHHSHHWFGSHPHEGKPPFFVAWKLHARAVRALLEAHFLYAIPVKALFEKLLGEGMKWQNGWKFEFLDETDLPPRLRRFPAGGAEEDLERLKSRVEKRLDVLAGRMARIEQALREPFSPLRDPRPARKSEARKPREAREALRQHNTGHHRHAKNRLLLRVYQSFLPQEHKLKADELQALSIYHYTLRPPRPQAEPSAAAREAERRLLGQARDALSRLPPALQSLAFGAVDGTDRPQNLNELILRVTRHAREQWAAQRGELPGCNREQTLQLARKLRLGVPSEAASPAKTPPAFALPLTRVAVGRMAGRLAGKGQGFHASTRQWVAALRGRQATHFDTAYYQAKIAGQETRRGRELWWVNQARTFALHADIPGDVGLYGQAEAILRKWLAELAENGA